MWEHRDVRVLITGGGGFIGSNLASALLTRKHQVRVIDDFSTGFPENIDGLDVELVKGSILDHDTLAGAARGVDSIVHLAARGSVPRSVADPLRTHDVNVNGTLSVLEVARESGTHVVFSSSSSVYGSVADLPRTES